MLYIAAPLLQSFTSSQQVTLHSYIILPLRLSDSFSLSYTLHKLHPTLTKFTPWKTWSCIVSARPITRKPSATQNLSTLNQLSLASRPSMLFQFLKLHRYEYYLPSEQITP